MLPNLEIRIAQTSCCTRTGISRFGSLLRKQNSGIKKAATDYTDFRNGSSLNLHALMIFMGNNMAMDAWPCQEWLLDTR
jgi:hypothetical protein